MKSPVTCQTADGDILIQPGDLLWIKSDIVERRIGNKLKNRRKVVAVMFLGQSNITEVFVFTAFSINAAPLYFNAIKTDINTVVKAMKKMNKFTDTDMCINKGTDKEYMISQEMFMSNTKLMSAMVFKKTGVRLPDLNSWTFLSIRWWGVYVLDAIHCIQSTISKRDLIASIRRSGVNRASKQLTVTQ